MEKNYSLSFDSLDGLKREADLNAPSTVDFTDQVMHCIQQESIQATTYGLRRHKGTLIRFASIVIVIMLLSGFVYAASTGSLSIKDESGREVMKVISSLMKNQEHEIFISRIHQAVKDQLKPGEAAFILYEQEDIDAIRRHEMPMSYSVVNQAFSYSTMEELPSSSLGSIAQLKLPIDSMGETKLLNIEALSNRGVPPTDQPEKWVESIDLKSGLTYIYYKYNPIAGSYDTLRFNYLMSGEAYTLMVQSGELSQSEAIKVRDSHPSADRVYESRGVPVYRSIDSEGSFFIWLQPTEDEELICTLIGAGEAEKPLEFVTSFIEVNTTNH